MDLRAEHVDPETGKVTLYMIRVSGKTKALVFGRPVPVDRGRRGVRWKARNSHRTELRHADTSRARNAPVTGES